MQRDLTQLSVLRADDHNCIEFGPNSSIVLRSAFLRKLSNLIRAEALNSGRSSEFSIAVDSVLREYFRIPLYERRCLYR